MLPESPPAGSTARSETPESPATADDQRGGRDHRYRDVPGTLGTEQDDAGHESQDRRADRETSGEPERVQVVQQQRFVNLELKLKELKDEIRALQKKL